MVECHIVYKLAARLCELERCHGKLTYIRTAGMEWHTQPSAFTVFLSHFFDVHWFLLSPKPPAPGIRLFYIDRNWVLRSRLIAVRQFNPTRELLDTNRLSALLEKYLESVLEDDCSQEFPHHWHPQQSRQADDHQDVRRDRFPVQAGDGRRDRCHAASAPKPRPVGGQVLELEVHR